MMGFSYQIYFFFIDQAHSNDRPQGRQTCCPTWTHFHDIVSTSIWSFPLIFRALLNREEIYTNFIVFDLTRAGTEPTIYCTQSEYANT
jgi:hypothetical protein